MALQAKSLNSTSVILFVSMFRHQPHLIFSFSDYSNKERNQGGWKGLFCINFTVSLTY